MSGRIGVACMFRAAEQTNIGAAGILTCAFVVLAIASLVTGGSAAAAGLMIHLGIPPETAVTYSFLITLPYTALVGGLGIALLRRNRAFRQQSQRLDAQSRDLDVSQKALHTQTIVSILDTHGKISFANENYTAIFSTDIRQLLDRTEAGLLWDEEAVQTQNDMLETVKRGEIWKGEIAMRDIAGGKRIMLTSAVPLLDTSGSHLKSILTRTDVTELRSAGNGRFFQKLIDNLNDQVFIYDAQSLEISYMNRSALNLCSWADSDALGKSIVQAHPTLTEEGVRAHIAPLLSKSVKTATIELEHETGPVEVRSLLHSEGSVVAILRDISKRKKLERARMETVSVVSHELRTPLTSIKGALRLMNSGALGPISTEAKTALTIADRNSERLLTIINDLLDLEKFRSGKMQLKLEKMDLAKFLSDAVTMNKGYADEHGVQLEFICDSSASSADISEERMMQVMSNLMSNAAKFSPAGGKVRVRLQALGHGSRISVSDDGPGIPEADRARVFESFMQLENVDENRRKGSGLGLAIAKEIVEAHGGSLDFRSAVGKGTTFFVDLPNSKLNHAHVSPLTRTTAA